MISQLPEEFADLGRVPSALHRYTQIIGAGLLLVVAWAALMPLDVVSIAEGEVIPADKIHQVAHLEGGVISEVLVAQGDTVSAGQSLLVLESTASGASVAELRHKIDSLAIDVVRLEALLAGKAELHVSDGFDYLREDLKNKAISLFVSQQETLQSQLAVQDEEVVRRQKQRAEIQARLNGERERVVLLDEQIAISEELMALDLANRYEHINLLKEVNALQSAIKQDEEVLLTADAAIKQAQEVRERIVAENSAEFSSRLDTAVRARREYEERVKGYEDNLKRTVLIAPTSGIVKRVYAFTRGGVVRAGETVMEIVPDQSQVVVKARLRPQDIGYVTEGDVAYVRLNSIDAVQFGYLPGEITIISPDTLVNEQGMAYYEVRIVTERDYFENDGARYPLVPGVVVTAGIVTGRRSVLRYIFSPFLKTTYFSLTER